MPKKFSQADYYRFAAEKGLRHINPLTPTTSRTPTQWKCIYCGKVTTKTLQAVRKWEIGCYCQSEHTLSYEAYFNLADSLGIDWTPRDGEYPSNTKDQTLWRGTNGNEVSASYNELYRIEQIPRRLRDALGI